MNFVVSHIPVVREHRAEKYEKAHDQGKRRYQLTHHVTAAD
jgi:hypothetical protein